MGDKIAPKKYKEKYPKDPPKSPPEPPAPPAHRNKWGPVGTPTAGFFNVQNYSFLFIFLFFFFFSCCFSFCVFCVSLSCSVSSTLFRATPRVSLALPGLRLLASA